MPAIPVVGADLADGDLTVAGVAADLVHRHDPAWVVHCAAWTDVDGAESSYQEAMAANARCHGASGGGVPTGRLRTDLRFAPTMCSMVRVAAATRQPATTKTTPGRRSTRMDGPRRRARSWWRLSTRPGRSCAPAGCSATGASTSSRPSAGCSRIAKRCRWWTTSAAARPTPRIWPTSWRSLSAGVTVVSSTRPTTAPAPGWTWRARRPSPAVPTPGGSGPAPAPSSRDRRCGRRVRSCAAGVSKRSAARRGPTWQDAVGRYVARLASGQVAHP